MSNSVHLLLPRYGLCNKLLTWAKALILANKTGKKLLVRGWFHFSIGPWLRGETNKRLYNGLLHQTPFFQFWISKLFQSKAINYQTLLSSPLNTDDFKETPYISDLPILANYYQEIKDAFLSLIKPGQSKAIAKLHAPFIGIHIRRGDYVKIGSTTELDYFKEHILKLRELLEFEAPVTIFTDGKSGELETLLEINNVAIFPSQNDLIDLLVLSKSKILITSKASSYSYWAAFISESVILHHPQTWVKQCRPAAINELFFEGIINWEAKQPELFIENIQNLKSQFHGESKTRYN